MYFILLFAAVLRQAESETHVMGFANRVSKKGDIKGALDNKAMAMEIDVCYDTTWYVSRSDCSECNCNSDTLAEWLAVLQPLLNISPYSFNFVAIWLKIKSVVSAVDKIPAIIHGSNLPEYVEVFYDLVLLNDKTVAVFDQLHPLITASEGIMFCAGGECGKKPEDIYTFFDGKHFKRGLISIDLSQPQNTLDLVTEANMYKCEGDPSGRGFKAVYGFTISSKVLMNKLINQSNDYSADGMLYGTDKDWDPSEDGQYVTEFNKLVTTYPDTFLPRASVDYVLKNHRLPAVWSCNGRLDPILYPGREFTRDQAYGYCWVLKGCTGIVGKYQITDSHTTSVWHLAGGTTCVDTGGQGYVSYLIGKICPGQLLNGEPNCPMAPTDLVGKCVAYKQCLNCPDCGGISRIDVGPKQWSLRKGTRCYGRKDGSTIPGTYSYVIRGL